MSDSGRACVFVLGGAACAVDVRDASEIVTLETWTPVPGAPPEVLGVMNLRGGVLAVVEARPLLGAPAPPAILPGTPAIVLVDGPSRAAVAVERVLGLEAYDPEMAAPDDASPFVRGRLTRDGGSVSLLDTPRLMSALRAAWTRKDA